MKMLFSAIAIAAGVVSAHAASLDPSRASESATTTYVEGEPFYHVAGDTSYVGAFDAGKGVCEVSVTVGPPVVTSAEKELRQIKFDLRGDEGFTFRSNSGGASLNLHCAADAKSLAIKQIWTPVVDASASD